MRRENTENLAIITLRDAVRGFAFYHQAVPARANPGPA
jgi:hypothetical protein